MDLTSERLKRYLKQQQQTNNYFLKLVTKDRKSIAKLLSICSHMFTAENEMGELISYVSRKRKKV
jgi:regulator of sirC expression with transglutaminase-like and TPR domain